MNGGGLLHYTILHYTIMPADLQYSCIKGDAWMSPNRHGIHFEIPNSEHL